MAGRRHRWNLAPLAALLILLLPAAAAADSGLAAFVGRFRGEAQSEAGDRFFITTLRNVTVELRREGDGFRLAWSTVIRDLTEGSGDGAPRRRDAELHFVPGPTPGTFHTPEPAAPFTGQPGAWATLAANRLIVYVLTIGAAGSWELQTYERTVTGAVMTLHFTRLTPGEPELVVTGRLMRQPD